MTTARWIQKNPIPPTLASSELELGLVFSRRRKSRRVRILTATPGG